MPPPGPISTIRPGLHVVEHALLVGARGVHAREVARLVRDAVELVLAQPVQVAQRLEHVVELRLRAGLVDAEQGEQRGALVAVDEVDHDRVGRGPRGEPGRQRAERAERRAAGQAARAAGAGRAPPRRGAAGSARPAHRRSSRASSGRSWACHGRSVSTPCERAAPTAAARIASCADGRQRAGRGLAVPELAGRERRRERRELEIADRGDRGLDRGERLAGGLPPGTQRAQPLDERGLRRRRAERRERVVRIGEPGLRRDDHELVAHAGELAEQRVVEQALAHGGGVARVEDVEAVERERDRPVGVAPLAGPSTRPSAGARSRSVATSGANIRIGPSPRTCWPASPWASTHAIASRASGGARSHVRFARRRMTAAASLWTSSEMPWAGPRGALRGTRGLRDVEVEDRGAQRRPHPGVEHAARDRRQRGERRLAEARAALERREVAGLEARELLAEQSRRDVIEQRPRLARDGRAVGGDLGRIVLDLRRGRVGERDDLGKRGGDLLRGRRVGHAQRLERRRRRTACRRACTRRARAGTASS